jgi:hypothetical protein
MKVVYAARGFLRQNGFGNCSVGKGIPHGCMDAAREDSRLDRFPQHRPGSAESKISPGARAGDAAQQWPQNGLQLAASCWHFGRLAGSLLLPANPRPQRRPCGHAVVGSGRQADPRQPCRPVCQTGDRQFADQTVRAESRVGRDSSQPDSRPVRVGVPVRPCLGHDQLAGEPSAVGLHRTAVARTDVRPAERPAGAREHRSCPVALPHEAGPGCRTRGMVRHSLANLVRPAGDGDCRWRLCEASVPASRHGDGGDRRQSAAEGCGAVRPSGTTAGARQGATAQIRNEQAVAGAPSGSVGAVIVTAGRRRA